MCAIMIAKNGPRLPTVSTKRERYSRGKVDDPFLRCRYRSMHMSQCTGPARAVHLTPRRQIVGFRRPQFGHLT